MNEFIRKLLLIRIKSALTNAKACSDIAHSGLTGKLREIVLDTLIVPLLNNNFDIGSGKIIDFRGNQSKETDLCIYSKNLIPPFFISRKDEPGNFPIESTLKCIEVKSLFNSETLRDAYEKFLYLENTLKITSGFYDEQDLPMSHYYIRHHYDYFSFDTLLKKCSAEQILNVYKKIDVNWNTDPLITNICIANKGWLCYTHYGWWFTSYNEVTKVNEEMLGYLSTLINDLPRIERSRGLPRLGYYLTNPRIGRKPNTI